MQSLAGGDQAFQWAEERYVQEHKKAREEANQLREHKESQKAMDKSVMCQSMACTGIR